MLEKIVKKIIAYIIEGIAIALVIYAVSKKTMSMNKFIIIAISLILTIGVLDLLAPEISAGAKQGYGFGTGWGLVGGGSGAEGFDNAGVGKNAADVNSGSGSASSATPNAYNNPFSGCPTQLKLLMNDLSPKVYSDNYVDYASA